MVASDALSPIQALRWEEGPEGPALVLLDQTQLPNIEAELVCTSIPTLVEAVRRLAVRGAPLLGLVGAYGVALAAARGFEVADAAERLANARPTAVNLSLGVRRALQAYEAALKEYGERHADEDEPLADDSRAFQVAAAAALAAARKLHSEDADASRRMGELGSGLLDELLPGAGGLRLLTHCNTGSLVSGGEGTAFAVALALHRRGRLARLWVDETRPLLQGSRLTAYEASRAGMPYTILADNAAGSLFAAGEVDAVLIGADRIAADGSTANKVGSYPLAVLARYHRVPFLVVAPESTVDLSAEDAESIVVEQRAAQELTEFAGHAVAPAGAAAYNPAFDIVPPSLVSAFVLESGVQVPESSEEWRISLPSVAQITER
jgi:methylthioribose-1-phosphate isomerase